jgi:predicted transposase/invertase (TIGR01784 family)
MSLNPDRFEPVRLEFHAAKLFTGQNIRGSSKKYNDLKQAYQIAILVKEKFFSDNVFFHTFEYYDPVHGVSLNGRSRIIALELSKLEGVVEKAVSEMNIQEQWAVYFRYLTDREKRSKINEIIKQDDGIAMASEVLMTVSRDEQERWYQMHREKCELDYQSRIATAFNDGKAEGKIEIAHNALSKGYPPEVIHEITGLDIETIKEIQTKNGDKYAYRQKF